MRAVAFLLVAGMIVKDLAFAPYPNVIRVAVQTICMLAFVGVMLQESPPGLGRRCWPLWCYLGALICTIPQTPFPLFVAMQVISVASAMCFFVVYCNRRQSRGVVGATDPIIMYVVVAYALMAVASLLLAKIAPGIAYGSLYAGDAVGDEIRFRGLLSKPGMMGAAAGLLVGLGFFAIRSAWLRVLIPIPGLLCLALTQSRTFWIAALFAGAATVCIFYPKWRLRVGWATAVVTAILLAATWLGVRLENSQAEQFARLDSVSTLTGRTQLWQAALEGFKEEPLFGFGFTMGSLGMEHIQSREAWSGLGAEDAQAHSRATTHNGYLQSLLDSGLVGTFFYVTCIVVALKRLLQYGRDRGNAPVFYSLLFLIVANFAESVIYSGSVFPSIFFWYCAAFAMTLEARMPAPANQPAAADGRFAPRVMPFRNLMR